MPSPQTPCPMVWKVLTPSGALEPSGSRRQLAWYQQAPVKWQSPTHSPALAFWRHLPPGHPRFWLSPGTTQVSQQVEFFIACKTSHRADIPFSLSRHLRPHAYFVPWLISMTKPALRERVQMPLITSAREHAVRVNHVIPSPWQQRRTDSRSFGAQWQ